MLKTWRLKKGDQVIVTTGKDKGKTGEVLSVLREEDRILVKGVNVIARHQRPQGGDKGGIIRKEAPIHASNVMHIDPKTKLPTRIGVKILENNKKVRYAKRSGDLVD